MFSRHVAPSLAVLAMLLLQKVQNYAKNYADTIDKGLVIDKELRLATPLGKRPSFEQHII